MMKSQPPPTLLLLLSLLLSASSETINKSQDPNDDTCETNNNNSNNDSSSTSSSSILALFKYLHVPLVITFRGVHISTIYLFQFVGGTIIFSFVIFIWNYRRSMKKKMKELSNKAPNLCLVRKKKKGTRGNMMIRGHVMAPELNLSKSYQAEIISNNNKEEEVQMMSLADYLSSLEPIGPLGNIAEEMEVLLGAALLRLLGPHMGAYLLPAMSALLASAVPFQAVAAAAAGNASQAREARSSSSMTAGLASASRESLRASFVASGAMKQNLEEENNKTVVATAAVQAPSAAVKALSGSSLLFMQGMTDAAVTINKALQSSSSSNDEENNEKKELYANDLMKQGEATTDTIPSHLLPNPFILSNHWDAAIEGLEQHEYKENYKMYDPNGYKVAEPVAIQDALLPDLYVGFGNAKRTLTNRVCVQNRVLCVLLNKLASNFLVLMDDEKKDKKLFGVKIDKNDDDIMTRPDDFIKALIQSGHTIETCSRTRLTSFSLGLCVREGGTDEEHPEWVHIPLGVCIRPGLEGRLKGQTMTTFLTHGGLDLDITSGPIISKASIQHYQSNQGFNGWFCNAYWDLPWTTDAVNCGPVYKNDVDVSRSVGVAALSAIIMNTTSTDLKLPLGGYGLVGVCNDNAGLIELAMTGKTHVYPMIGVGRYLSHSIRKGRDFLERMQDEENVAYMSNLGLQINDETVEEVKNLLKAMMKLPNDVHVLPQNTCEAAKRMLHCIPRDVPFELLEETRDHLEVLIEESEKWI